MTAARTVSGLWATDPVRLYALAAAAISVLVLASMHVLERFGYEPCTLCLRQREVFWVAVGGVVGFVLLSFLRPAKSWPPLTGWLLSAVFLTGFGIAVFHAGVEWKFWPGLETCGGGGRGLSGTDLLAALDGPVRAARCDEAALRILGLSLAGWNVLLSLCLAVFGIVAAARANPSILAAEPVTDKDPS